MKVERSKSKLGYEIGWHMQFIVKKYLTFRFFRRLRLPNTVSIWESRILVTRLYSLSFRLTYKIYAKISLLESWFSFQVICYSFHCLHFFCSASASSARPPDLSWVFCQTGSAQEKQVKKITSKCEGFFYGFYF